MYSCMRARPAPESFCRLSFRRRGSAFDLRGRVRCARAPDEAGDRSFPVIASLNTQACRPESVAIYDTAIYIENTRIEHFRAHTFRDCICTSTLDTLTIHETSGGLCTYTAHAPRLSSS